MKSWLTGILAASLLSAIASALTRKSASRSAVQLAGGLLISLAVLWPLQGLHSRLPSLPTFSEAQLSDTQSVLRTEMAAKAASYVEEQAQEKGICCAAEVTLDDALLPVHAVLYVDSGDAGELRSLVCTALSLSSEQVSIEIEEDS